MKAPLTEEDPRPRTGDSSGSSVLSQVDARQLRRLFDQIIPKQERRKNPKARKLEKTMELLQANREILSHENKDLRRAVFLEKRKRKRRNPLKNYLLDPEDGEQGAPIVFSPAKIQRAREKKAEIEAQGQAEEARKRQEKIERELKKEQAAAEKRQRAEERERVQEERQRQREEEKQQKLVTQQLKTDSIMQRQQQKDAAKQARAETRARKRASRKDNQETAASLSTSAAADLPEAPQGQARPTTPNQAIEPASGSLYKIRQATRGRNKPMLVIETDSEVLEAGRPRTRPKRNTKLPDWLEGFELG